MEAALPAVAEPLKAATSRHDRPVRHGRASPPPPAAPDAPEAPEAPEPEGGAACAELNVASADASAVLTTLPAADLSRRPNPALPDRAICQRWPIACATNKAVCGGAALPAGTGMTEIPNARDRSPAVRVSSTMG